VHLVYGLISVDTLRAGQTVRFKPGVVSNRLPPAASSQRAASSPQSRKAVWDAPSRGVGSRFLRSAATTDLSDNHWGE